MSTTVYKGPAQISWGSNTFETKGDCIVTLNPESFDVMTDAWGTVDQRLKSRSYTVAFEPTGNWYGEALTMMIAAAERLPGTSIMDGQLIIQPYVAGQSILTLDQCGATSLPTLRLGASKTLYGGLTLTALETAGATTGVIGAVASHINPVEGFDPSQVMTEPWTGTWTNAALGTGNSFLTDIETEDGWEINCEIATEPSRADSVGITDLIQTDFKITASCTPVGLTEAQILEVVQRSTSGMGMKPGDSFHGRTALGVLERRNLVLTNRTGHTITINDCGVRAGVLRYGAKANRTGALSFVGLRKFTTGVMQPMIVFGEPA